MPRFWVALTVCVGVALLGPVSSAQAGPSGRLLRELAEQFIRRGGPEVAEETVETLAPRLARVAAEHGDDALQAVRRAGYPAVAAIEQAGAHADDVVRLCVRHGDEAVWLVSRPQRLAIFYKYGDDAGEALVRHRQVAVELLEKIGRPAGPALARLSPQQGRRLAMLADQGDLVRWGRTDELLSVLARHGDVAMDFIWKHKGALAVGATLTAFLADPEPFLSGARQLAGDVAQHVAPPAVEAVGQVAQSVVQRFPWEFGLILLGGIIGWVYWRRHRPRSFARSV